MGCKSEQIVFPQQHTWHGMSCQHCSDARNGSSAALQVNAITNGTASLGTLGGKTTEGDDDQDSEATDGNQE